MAPRPRWVDGRVDVLLDALEQLSMSMSRTAAAELITERVDWVAQQMGMTPATARGYLTDEALADLAQTLVFSLVDETPGADVLQANRSTSVPMSLVARCVAGLATCVQIRLRESADVEHLRTVVGHLADVLSAVGQVIADQPGTTPGRPVTAMLPPSLINRVARHLEVGSVAVADGVLPADFDPKLAQRLGATLFEDARQLRECISP